MTLVLAQSPFACSNSHDPGQTDWAALVFNSKGIAESHSEDVNVSVYSVESRREAVAWLAPVRNRQVASGWQVNPYQIGDEGYLSKYKDGERFDIEFRRGNIVAKIAGNDLHMVKDFAQCIPSD